MLCPESAVNPFVYRKEKDEIKFEETLTTVLGRRTIITREHQKYIHA
jgi:hypothetical protein